MGYRDDQFYQFPAQLGRTTTSTSSGDNPPFLYPGSNRHRLDVVKGSKIVKRGFIKSLLDDSDVFKNLSGGSGASPASFGKRMFFQFNPSLITQNVTQSSGSLPLLQDPGQLTQPMIGDTNFSFEIMLDRQMEVNRLTTSDYLSPGNSPSGISGGTPSDPDIDVATNPTDIGVFADLKVLYSIIGQGLSADQVEIYKSLLKKSTARSSDDSESTADAATESAFSEEVPYDSLNTNIGNSAFLAPLPIRIVFSSLFMVDGFVTGTQVLFTKFNANMVPVQARVGLSVQAIYVGFARPKTVFNAALASATDQSLETELGPIASDGTSTANGDPEDLKKLLDFEKYILDTFKIQVFGEEKVGKDWDNPVTFNNNEANLTEKLLGNKDISVFCGFPKSKTDDAIVRYMEDGNSFSISYSFTLRVLRDPVPSSDEGTGRWSKEIMRFEAGTSGLAGQYGITDSGIASSVEAYKRVRKLKLNSEKGWGKTVDAYYYGSDNTQYDPPNSGPKLFLSDTNFDNFVKEGKLLKVEVDFRMSISMNSSEGGTTTREYRPGVYQKFLPINKRQCLDLLIPTLAKNTVGRDRK